MRKKGIALAVLLVLAGSGAFYVFGRGLWYPLLLRVTGPRTVQDVVARYGPATRRRLAASGHAGPKLREGDYQVPEGLYRIEHLNPNSSYHLSMKVSYPNDWDRRMAARDARMRLGGDIFIHGNRVSIGCVAIGDPAIEELFTLVAETGRERVKVIIAPNDLRARGAIIHHEAPTWVGQLYRIVAAALIEFPLWMESDSAFDVNGASKVRVKEGR